MASSADSEIDKPGAQKRVELPDVNINTGVQSINAERATSMNQLCNSAISTTFDGLEKVKTPEPIPQGMTG